MSSVSSENNEAEILVELLDRNTGTPATNVGSDADDNNIPVLVVEDRPKRTSSNRDASSNIPATPHVSSDRVVINMDDQNTGTHVNTSKKLPRKGLQRQDPKDDRVGATQTATVARGLYRSREERQAKAQQASQSHGIDGSKTTRSQQKRDKFRAITDGRGNTTISDRTTSTRMAASALPPTRGEQKRSKLQGITGRNILSGIVSDDCSIQCLDGSQEPEDNSGANTTVPRGQQKRAKLHSITGRDRRPATTSETTTPAPSHMDIEAGSARSEPNTSTNDDTELGTLEENENETTVTASSLPNATTQPASIGSETSGTDHLPTTTSHEGQGSPTLAPTMNNADLAVARPVDDIPVAVAMDSLITHLSLDCFQTWPTWSSIRIT